VDRRRCEPDASLEVSSPSAFAGRAALSVAAVPSDDPASAFSHRPTTRASTDLSSASVAHAVLRSSDARRSCSSADLLAACGLANRSSPPMKQTEQPARKSAGQRSSARASPANPILPRSRTTRHIKQHRFANPPPLCRVMHRRVLRRGVPLPRHEACAAWPDDGSFPLGSVTSRFARRRSWGSFLRSAQRLWSAVVLQSFFLLAL